MSTPEQAVITNATIARGFRVAHETLQEVAIAAVRDEGGAIQGEGDVLVRFSGETHEVAIQVAEEDLAPRGLMRRLRPSVSVNLYATVTDNTQPEQPPVKLWLNAIRSGRRRLLDPELTGSFMTPMDMGGDWPKGAMAGHLEYTTRMLMHQRQAPPVTSMDVLKSTVDMVINANPATLTRSVEGVLEAEPDIEFSGTERQRAAAIITPFMESVQTQHGRYLETDVRRMVSEKGLTSLQLTNELSAAATDCPIIVRMDQVQTSIALQPTEAWGDIPPLYVTCSTSTDPESPRSFIFLDADNRVLQLTRPQRQQLLLLLEEKLSDPAQFDHVKNEYDMQLPDESVLAACEQLAGDTELNNYTIVTGEGADAKSVRVWLKRQDDHFVGVMQAEGAAPFVISLGAQHFSMDDLAQNSRADPQKVLEFYDILRKLANPDSGQAQSGLNG